MYSSISSGAALRASPTRLVVVAGVHVAAIWALINGLHLHALTNALPQVSEATVIDQGPMPAPDVTGAAVDPRHPLTQPAYPPAAIRGNEEGALNLLILVGTDGRVRDVKVAQSSGSSRLDEAAMSEAKAHWRLRPAMRNGVPFEQWLTLRVVFHLENR